MRSCRAYADKIDVSGSCGPIRSEVGTEEAPIVEEVVKKLRGDTRARVPARMRSDDGLTMSTPARESEICGTKTLAPLRRLSGIATPGVECLKDFDTPSEHW